MMLKTAGSVTALTLALGVVGAAAQTGPQQVPSAAAPKMPVTGQILVQDPNTILANEFIGLAVYTPEKTKIGKISDLILSKDATAVEGIVVGVGGFLGLGEKSVALKLDRLQIGHDPKGGLQLTMSVNKEELTNAPEFKSKRQQDVEREAERAREQQVRPPSGGMPKPTH